MKPVVEARGAGYMVRGGRLVTQVSLALKPGALTVVVGPNGAGKSTLMRLLSGELRAQEGAVLYEGEPVERVAAWRLAAMRAVLPQSSPLSFPFAVAEVVRIGLDGIGRGLKARDKEAMVAQALARADVLDLAHRQYQTLSGGEKQRVQFARVLCQLDAGRTLAARQVLFLDEPIANLDLKHQLGLLDAVRALASAGLAVIAILHDLNMAATYADEIVVMHRGAMAGKGPPGEIISDAMIARVFGVPLRVGQVPVSQPFVLPQRDLRAP